MNGCRYCTWVHKTAVKELGLDDEAVLELMAVVDLFSGLNKLVVGLQIEPDDVISSLRHQLDVSERSVSANHPIQTLMLMQQFTEVIDQGLRLPMAIPKRFLKAVAPEDLPLAAKRFSRGAAR